MTTPKDRLKRIRRAAGFASASEAARAFPRELNLNTLISHENGHRDISKSAAEKYGRIFSADAGWILYGGDPNRPDIAELLLLWREMNDQQRDMTLRMLEGIVSANRRPDNS